MHTGWNCYGSEVSPYTFSAVHLTSARFSSCFPHLLLNPCVCEGSMTHLDAPTETLTRNPRSSLTFPSNEFLHYLHFSLQILPLIYFKFPTATLYCHLLRLATSLAWLQSVSSSLEIRPSTVPGVPVSLGDLWSEHLQWILIAHR